MLPAVVASDLQDAVREFLRSAFPIATSYFQTLNTGERHSQALIDDLLQRPGALFKGPFLDIKLPFRLAETEELPFRYLHLPFAPYRHQLTAFQRLTGEAPQSTIVATGTGSGKTECFMLPVLDDCLHRREQGIKTIVVYPMNALATDQARRFAEEVAKLDTQLSVGLYVGGEQNDVHTGMGAENVITCQKTLRRNPPDVLLTNYKMLDFLLIRPKDQLLWRYNKPGMLRYLVVDELHSFDGAQGTDLACLIRRLRDRLEVGPELACVGTSATMGTDSLDSLLKYASEVFATEFEAASVVGEDRLSADEYLLGRTPAEQESRRDAMQFFHWPERLEQRLNPASYDTAEDYLYNQAQLWFDELPIGKIPRLNASDERGRAEAAVQLGLLLHQHTAFHELVRATEKLTDLSQLAGEWQQKLNLPKPQQAQALLASLVSLVAVARLWWKQGDESPAKWCQPFLNIRAQLWLRELRRLVCSVPVSDEPPQIQFADDLQNPAKPLHLPLLHCRECHMAAWGAVTKQGDTHLECDLQTFYQNWFQFSPQSLLMVPLVEGEKANGLVQSFCTACMRLQSSRKENTCIECESATLRKVWVPDMRKPPSQAGSGRLQCHHNCPDCGARDSLAVMGYRAATLTSVMAGRLFATPYNDDYKLIAFSDSVQDAAHRAGFLGANTWRQVARQALVAWLDNQPTLVSLESMAKQLPAYWQEKVSNDARFCGLFIAPNMTWLHDYGALTRKGALPPKSNLPELVCKRLAWECFAEFGRRGTLGRSLERTGMAAIGLDHQRLIADVQGFAGRLREEVECLRQVTDEEFVRFVIGWLHHMRQSGAIYDPVLDGYLDNKGKEFLINRFLPWMPGFGRSQRPPAAVTLQHFAPNFEALVLTNRDTWAVRWLKKTLASEAVFAAAEARQIFQVALQSLTKAGWLIERHVAGDSVYLLNADRLMVSSKTAASECNVCRHRTVFAPEVGDLYESLPCMRSHCLGKLGICEPGGRTRDYGITEPRRLVPGEHTGLLPRDVREATERSFIKGVESWDINLLSATPTLEMGIDIGSLSSVFLCSVPPAQANYLQRIGRAGRRDGNALALTVANGQNHDLFFYSDPMEMMAGAVQTPGVFLQAIAVLERQLIAYCFGRWAATGIDESAIPGQLRKAIDAVEHKRLDQFPYNLIGFIDGHHASLLSGFLGLFDALEEDAKHYLKDFILGTGEGGLAWRLVNRLQQLVEERASLLKKTQQLKKERERLEKMPEDAATQALIDEVKRERGALLSLLHGLNSQPVLNFFTDEGLLPNYAFPEEGVTLQSVILRRRSKDQQKDGESAFEKTPYVFQRPAQAALSELAPESRFYAVSHEMQIDQIDLQVSPTEDWRFCARCQYTERVDLVDRHSACPRCGSPQWADSGQKNTVLRLRQVYSTVDDRANRIGDDSDQREPQFFNRQMLVDTPPDGNAGGFRLKSEVLPFGFEFLRRATFREVNFGISGGDTHTFSVAGHEQSRRGFRICRHCGKVQKERPRKNEQLHAYTCKLRKHPDQESPEDYFESLYLYRELNSEAIRVLLPLSEVAYSDEKLHSFIAALNLGLRTYFHGDVHHLEVTDMQEPATMESGERIYLVIYDRIPGGTGYLKELMRSPDNLMKVLDAAYQRLVTCSCIDDERLDGCYRCILAYRDSRNMSTITRRGAAELLGEILALRGQLEPVESLSEIGTNVLIESKLEQKFIDALPKLPGAQMTNQMVNGKAGSLLTLPGADGRPMPWLVEHQVMAGPSEHVAQQTKIDVLLTPARAQDAARYRPIAVYLDGLQYHHDIVADDVSKRTALLLSGRYWVFSLNWDDLPEPGKLPKPHESDLMRKQCLSQSKLNPLYDGMAAKAGWHSYAEHAATNTHGGLERLSRLLRNPDEANQGYMQRAVLRGFSALVPEVAKDVSVLQKVGYELNENAPSYVVEAMNLEASDSVPGGFMDAFGNSTQGVEMTAVLPMSAIQQNDADGIAKMLRLHICFDDRNTQLTDDFKANWRAFWHAANQLQYLPGFSMATRSAVSTGALDNLWSTWRVLKQSQTPEPAEPGTGSEETWSQVFEYSSLLPEQLQALIDLGIPEPDVGVDLATPEGEVIIGGHCVELCWQAHSVAVLSEATSAAFSGWHLVVADESMIGNIEKLIKDGVF